MSVDCQHFPAHPVWAGIVIMLIMVFFWFIWAGNYDPSHRAIKWSLAIMVVIGIGLIPLLNYLLT